MKHKIIALLAAVSAELMSSPTLAAQDGSQVAGEHADAGISADDVRKDLDALYSAMQEASVDLYAYRSKKDFDAFHAGLRAGVTEPMSRLEAALVLQRLAAFARIGHIRSYAWLNELFAKFSNGAEFAPIFIRVERDGRVFLTKNAIGDPDVSVGFPMEGTCRSSADFNQRRTNCPCPRKNPRSGVSRAGLYG